MQADLDHYFLDMVQGSFSMFHIIGLFPVFHIVSFLLYASHLNVYIQIITKINGIESY